MEYNPAEQATAKDEALAFLNKVLEAIRVQCRQIFRRYYWDKMSKKDIAASMGLKNDDVTKAIKSKCMKKSKDIAKAMLADDEMAEEVVRRSIEREALRDLFEECRKEESGNLARAAYINDN